MTAHEDAELVYECLKGNSQAFEVLVDRYQKPVFNLAYRMSCDLDNAKDITQNVFIKAFERLRSYDSKFRFFSWIYRMALNESMNFVNHQNRFESISDHAVSPEKTPSECYESLRLSAKIQKALLSLSSEYRAVIVLRHFEGLSYSEISELAGIPEKKVKSRLFSARKLLGEILLKAGLNTRD
jgi:RNA polymerase sigma-70 factor (ECF subfamily)